MDERDRDRERDDDDALDGALFIDAGAEPRHRASHKDDEQKAAEARDVLRGIISRMGLAADVTVREVGERIVLDVTGPDAGRAIGKKGQTLDALQFIVNKVVNRLPDNRRYIIVDSGDYRERHDESLVNMARREAKRAVQQGRTITLAPMPARDRRLIHLSLAKMAGVTTRSNGEGLGRRIQIIPSRGSTGAATKPPRRPRR